MRRGIQTLIVAATVGLVWSPVSASADGFVSPWVGTNFANDPGEGRASFGATAGVMGKGIIGAEVDFGYSPNYFGDGANFGSNNLMNVMGNLIVGIPIGGQRGAGRGPSTNQRAAGSREGRALRAVTLKPDGQGGLRVDPPETLPGIIRSRLVNGLELNVFKYSPHPDGRFLVVADAQDEVPPTIQVIINGRHFIAERRATKETN